MLEDIAINEAEKRTGTKCFFVPSVGDVEGKEILLASPHYIKIKFRLALRREKQSYSRHSIHKFGCLQHCMKTLSIQVFMLLLLLLRCD